VGLVLAVPPSFMTRGVAGVAIIVSLCLREAGVLIVIPYPRSFAVPSAVSRHHVMVGLLIGRTQTNVIDVLG